MIVRAKMHIMSMTHAALTKEQLDVNWEQTKERFGDDLMSIDLPPLPLLPNSDAGSFSALAMHNYAKAHGEACARAALEAAAKACDDYETYSWGEFGAAEGCAAAIRALITKA